jgi:hypothetical protein
MTKKHSDFAITFLVWCATTAILGTLACQIAGAL